MPDPANVSGISGYDERSWESPKTNRILRYRVPSQAYLQSTMKDLLAHEKTIIDGNQIPESRQAYTSDPDMKAKRLYDDLSRDLKHFELAMSGLHVREIAMVTQSVDFDTRLVPAVSIEVSILFPPRMYVPITAVRVCRTFLSPKVVREN